MKSLRSYFYRAAGWLGMDLDNALCWFAMQGDTGMVKALLEAGADVHAEDNDALRMAAVFGHSETVRALLEGGADIHAQEDEALRLAEFGCHAETVALLQEWSAREERTASFEKTGLPEHKAVKAAYVLAAETMTSVHAGIRYFNTICLDAAKVIRNLPDASESQKIKWITTGYLFIADEFSGERRDDLQNTIRDIAKMAGVPDDVLNASDINLDQTMEIKDIPNDVKVLVAAGIVAGVASYLGARGNVGTEESAMAERFNRHAAGIHVSEIPASLHEQMTESVARFHERTERASQRLAPPGPG